MARTDPGGVVTGESRVRTWLYTASPDLNDLIAHGLKTLYQPMLFPELPDDLQRLMAALEKAERRRNGPPSHGSE